MSIQMILLDLDGTLLTSDKRLSPGNRAALERAAARGVHIVPSTGRFYSGMPQVVRELPFVRYVVSINGGGQGTPPGGHRPGGRGPALPAHGAAAGAL